MKKFYYSVFAAATMLLATTSCSQDEELVQQGTNDVTTFKVELQGAVGSRAAGDGKTVDRLYYEVYQGGTKVLDNLGDASNPANASEVVIEDGVATVEMPLLRGEIYDIIFWAQKGSGSIYTATNLQAISVDYNNADANVEAYDAFFNALDDFKATSNPTTVELRRPFAQLNVLTTTTDWNQAKDMVGKIDDIEVAPVTGSKVVVHGLATKFNALTGEASEIQENVTFSQAAITAEEVTIKNVSYINLAMNYLLVPGTKAPQGTGTHEKAENNEVKAITNVDATFWRNSNELFTLTVLDAPIQRNYRTNIMGNLLADDKTFEVIVVPGFDEEAHNIYNYDVATTSDFGETLATLNSETYNGPTDVVITLDGDIEWATGASHGSTPFLTDNSKVKTLTIMGNNHTITATGSGVGAIRAANDGKLIFNDVNIVDESVSYAENSWELGYLEFAGNLEFNNSVFKNAIMICGATANNTTGANATFVGCTFNSNKGEYGVWVSGNNVSFTECTFKGPRPSKLMECYGSVIETAIFDACIFDSNGEINKPGVVIGVIVEPGEQGSYGSQTWTKPASAPVTNVTIKNSIFTNCGLGDTNECFVVDYISESDTDYKKFTFINENNTIFNDGAAQDLTITNVATLKAFAASVNNGTSYAGKTVTLGADLDLANEPWTPIGACNSKTYFQGNFDGNGKTISNLYVDNSTDTYKNSTSGLFGWIDAAKATIKNVKIDGATVKGSHWTGVIAGFMTGEISDCTVNNATVICNNVNEDANGDKVGGIVGYVNSNSIKLSGNTVTNSTITGNREVGGIAGTVANDLGEMKNNKVENVAITYITDNDYASAGIFASGRNNYIPDASNTSDNVTIAKLVDNADALRTAITNATDGAIIALADGTYTGLFTISSKNLTLQAVNKDKAIIDGMIFGESEKTIKLNGLTLTNEEVYTIPNGNAGNRKAVVVAYQSNFEIENCTFILTGSDKYGFYDESNDANNYNTIKNCVFNCNGNRPIMAKTNITVDNCTFNDQYKYCLQVMGQGDVDYNTKVIFTNNVINDACKTSGKNVQGLSIGKNHPFKNVSIEIKGNTSEGVNYVYDNVKNVTDYWSTVTITGDVTKDDFKGVD